MVWFLVDDVLPFHERVLRAGNAAMGLWVRAGAYCSGQLTDGFVPAEVARTLGSAGEIRRLVDVGLWVPADGGYRFHAWAEDGTGQKRQPTKAEVEEKRRIERERKARARAAKRTPDGTPDRTPDGTPPHVPAGVPQGVPLGHPADVRPESQRASALPDQTKPYQEEKRPIETADAVSISPDRTADADLSGPPEPGTEIVRRKNPPAASSGRYAADFEAFWALYPRHEGKRAAATAWERALRRTSPAVICAAAARYRDDPNREAAFTAHAATWLNRDGWDDAPLPQRRPSSQQERLEQSTRDTLAALHQMGVAG